MAKINPERPEFLVRPDQIPFGLKGAEREKAIKEHERLFDKYAEDLEKYFPENLVKFDSVEKEDTEEDKLFDIFIDWLNPSKEWLNAAGKDWGKIGLKEDAPESAKEAFKEWQKKEEERSKGIWKGGKHG